MQWGFINDFCLKSAVKDTVKAVLLEACLPVVLPACYADAATAEGENSALSRLWNWLIRSMAFGTGSRESEPRSATSNDFQLIHLLENTPNIISLYDRNLRLIHFGSKFKQRYGSAAQTGSRIWSIYPIFQDSVLREELKRVLNERATIDLALPVSPNALTTSIKVFSTGDGVGLIEISGTKTDSLVQPSDEHFILLHQATHDVLTGLRNRRQFSNDLQRALSLAADTGKSVALLLIDLDGFKSVNDTLGHGVGDSLLQLVANRIQAAMGENETAYRNAGDEFAVIQIAKEQPLAAERLAKAIVELVKSKYLINNIPTFVGASIGIAIAPEHGIASEDLMKAADVALYAAKRDGKGCARIYSRSMMLLLEERENLRRSLAMALEQREFHLEYQPIVRPPSRLVGFEALLSWRHPELGTIRPEVFIPIAEADGLMDEIGKWVLEEACKQAMTWPSTLSIAVNLSPAQFLSGSITDTIARILDTIGIEADRLELEITETILLEKTVDNVDTLNILNVLGVKVSLDDFGTYYSSLSYLKTFPFDIIKIDKYFIEDVDKNVKSKAIVQSIIKLAHSLGINVTAEGVETTGQAEWLKRHDCDRLQGFLIGRPMGAQETRRFIDKQTRRYALSTRG